MKKGCQIAFTSTSGQLWQFVHYEEAGEGLFLFFLSFTNFTKVNHTKRIKYSCFYVNVLVYVLGYLSRIGGRQSFKYADSDRR